MRLFNAEHPPIPWLGVCRQQEDGRWTVNAHWGYTHIMEEGCHKRLAQVRALLNVAVWGITGRTLWQWEDILCQVGQWFKKVAEAHPKISLVLCGLAVIWFMALASAQLVAGNWWLTVVNVIGVAYYGSLARLAYRHLRYLPLEIRQAVDRANGEGYDLADHNAAYARIMREQRAADILAGQVNRQGHTQQQAAIGRAWATLYGYLSESEQEQLAEHGFFDVPSKLTVGRVYSIPVAEGTASVLDNGQLVMTICARPEDAGIPWPDVMLSYKLGLQADEERWLETANKWPLAQPQGQGQWLYDEYVTVTDQIRLIEWDPRLPPTDQIRLIDPPAGNSPSEINMPVQGRHVNEGFNDDSPPCILEQAGRWLYDEYITGQNEATPEQGRVTNDVNIILNGSDGFATVTIPRGTNFSANFSWAGDSLDVSDVVIAGERMPYCADVCMEEIAPDDPTLDVPGTEACESFTLTPTVSAVQNFITPTIAERIRQTEQGPARD